MKKSLVFNSWIKLQVAAYDKTQGKMAFFDPSRPQDFLFISGTKVIFNLITAISCVWCLITTTYLEI